MYRAAIWKPKSTAQQSAPTADSQGKRNHTPNSVALQEKHGRDKCFAANKLRLLSCVGQRASDAARAAPPWKLPLRNGRQRPPKIVEPEPGVQLWWLHLPGPTIETRSSASLSTAQVSKRQCQAVNTEQSACQNASLDFPRPMAVSCPSSRHPSFAASQKSGEARVPAPDFRRMEGLTPVSRGPIIVPFWQPCRSLPILTAY